MADASKFANVRIPGGQTTHWAEIVRRAGYDGHGFSRTLCGRHSMEWIEQSTNRFSGCKSCSRIYKLRTR